MNQFPNKGPIFKNKALIEYYAILPELQCLARIMEISLQDVQWNTVQPAQLPISSSG
ncbi:45913_t:CDS:2 [Gigaspora margarita]|uniref:45913_t:CDS:1 n=1 Tax=Gigaspora margarita TaxID=4874 RepID=A0ABN7UP91_GIGMA|nr:45913_t:CDS:2 [Gigaspora margarita]